MLAASLGSWAQTTQPDPAAAPAAANRPLGPLPVPDKAEAPAGGDASHMKILASLARRLIRAQFKQTLREAQDPAEVAEFVRKEVS